MRPLHRIHVAIAASLAIAPAALAHEILVGRSPQNQILVVIDGDPFDLPPSVFPGFPGFANSNPGFVSTPDDSPEFLQLPTTVNIEWELLSIETHLQVWNDTGTAPMVPGEFFSVGGSPFHSHPIWHSPDGTPGESYSASFRVHDLSGQLTVSSDYTVNFIPVPEPTAIALVGVGFALLMRRRA